MNRAARLGLAALVAVAGVAASAPSASASFHLMKIRSVFRGPTAPGAFVELQMTADGQNLVGGHQVKVYNATATASTNFTLPSNVANGQNQRMILLGDVSAPGTPDFTLPGIGASLTGLAGGGALCFDTVDCVSWGAFTGNALLPSSAGTPISGGLSGSMVSVRTITAGCATALDEADDTNVSNADFGVAVGYPMRNNSATPTETLCPTSPGPGTTNGPGTTKKKCKKKKKKAGAAAKKKCKKKK